MYRNDWVDDFHLLSKLPSSIRELLVLPELLCRAELNLSAFLAGAVKIGYLFDGFVIPTDIGRLRNLGKSGHSMTTS